MDPSNEETPNDPFLRLGEADSLQDQIEMLATSPIGKGASQWPLATLFVSLVVVFGSLLSITLGALTDAHESRERVLDLATIAMGGEKKETRRNYPAEYAATPEELSFLRCLRQSRPDVPRLSKEEPFRRDFNRDEPRVLDSAPPWRPTSNKPWSDIVPPTPPPPLEPSRTPHRTNGPIKGMEKRKPDVTHNPVP